MISPIVFFLTDVDDQEIRNHVKNRKATGLGEIKAEVLKELIHSAGTSMLEVIIHSEILVDI